MARGWIYALGWLAFGLCMAFALPHRAAGLEASLRDQIEDDLEANGLTDFRVDMDGQRAILSYRDDAAPSDDPRQRMLKAARIAGDIPGDLPGLRPAGGPIFGPVTVVDRDDDSLAAVEARRNTALAQASASASSIAASSASTAASASLVAARACTDDVTAAVASRKLSFVTGSAELDGDSAAVLQDIYNTIRRCPDDLVLSVEGHTDNVGGLDHNMQLSASRADAAAAALIRLGLPAASVQSHGYGPNDPIADNSTNSGRAKNRRVDFVLRPAEQGG